ncbi:MAG: cyclic nucleotide-binding domain-containing protein [Deltaproteobacteria bacterium]|nr:cyclic nucleotide-binding domain-containing protein [Deltaproteobacteria bacterium]
MTTADRIQALGSIHMFSGLTPRSLERIAALAEEQTAAIATVLFRAGDPGDKLYLILDGKVRISRDVPGLGEEALAVLGEGEYFGEMALVDDAPRSADARVHERCKLLVIDKDELQHLLFLHKEIAYEILWNVTRTLAARLRETNEKMTFLAASGKFS